MIFSFLKEDVHKKLFIVSRRPNKFILEDLGELAGPNGVLQQNRLILSVNFLQVIEQNLEEGKRVGSTLIADRMAMSPRQFYRKFKEISPIAPA